MNTGFNWTKGLGFGIALWFVMFVIALALGWVGVTATLTTNVIVALVAGVIAFLFAMNVQAPNAVQALGYGFLWAVLGLVLDLGVVHGFDYSVMASWQYWMLYVAVLVAPVVHQLGVVTRQDYQQVHSY